MKQRANSLVIVLLTLATLIGFTSAIGSDDIAGVTAGQFDGAVPGDGLVGPGIGLGPGDSGLVVPDADGATGGVGPSGSGEITGGAGGAGSVGTGGQGRAPGTTGELPPLKVAYLIQDTTGAGAFGLDGTESDGSAEDREFRALFDWVNQRGGIAGRPVEARGFRITLDDKVDENRLVQRCVEIAEDYGASYVIDTQVMGYPSTQQCFAQRGVVLVTWAWGGLTEEAQRRQLPYVATTAPTTDQMFTTLVPRLQDVDYLRGAKVGVFLNDDPLIDGPYERILKPALARAGTPPAAEARAGDFDQAAINNAVLQFRSEGVTHVIFLGHIFQIVAFTNSAESQGYRPRYAFTDYFTANRSAGAAPPEQLREAVGVSAFYDVITEDASRSADDVSSPYDRDSIHPGFRRCLDTLSEARGTDYYQPGQAGASPAFMEICDHFLLWRDAVTAARGNFNPAGFGAGLRALGTNYRSPRVYATGFGDGRQVGATHFAAGIYNPDCGCYPRLTPWSSR